jgi:uncharacterized protein (UPF0333 family)
MESQGNKKTIFTVAVLLAIVLIVGGAVAFSKHGKSTANADTATVASTVSATPSTTTASATATDATNTAATYKDGTYKTDISYDSPGGMQKIGVNITLKDGTVTDSTVTAEATDGDARGYQNDFVSSYKQFVTGKKIDAISLSRVSGSSLTSNGFNYALKTIEAQAKA